MSRFAQRFGFPALSLVCVITLGWPHSVRNSLYRTLYPLVALDQTTLTAPPSELTPLGSWEKWQTAGMDSNSAIADPQFKNAAKDDYHLQPGSPALKLGFQSIPFEKIGLAGDPRAWKP